MPRRPRPQQARVVSGSPLARCPRPRLRCVRSRPARTDDAEKGCRRLVPVGEHGSGARRAGQLQVALERGPQPLAAQRRRARQRPRRAGRGAGGRALSLRPGRARTASRRRSCPRRGLRPKSPRMTTTPLVMYSHAFEQPAPRRRRLRPSCARPPARRQRPGAVRARPMWRPVGAGVADKARWPASPAGGRTTMRPPLRLLPT